MKKLAFLLLLPACTYTRAQEPLYDNVIFENSAMSGFYYYSQVQYQAPSWIKNQQQKLPVNNTRFFTPGNSLELQYRNDEKGYWKATVLKPRLRGQDKVRPGTLLLMKIFVESLQSPPGALPAVRLEGQHKAVSDSVPLAKYIRAYAGGKWLTVTIPLSSFNLPDTALSPLYALHFSQLGRDGQEHRLLIDQIEILPPSFPPVAKTAPAIALVQSGPKHVDLEWNPVADTTVRYVKIYRSEAGSPFHPVGITGRTLHRYADYTGETGKTYQYKISFVGYDYSESALSAPAAASTRPMTDSALLTMVQQACFRYYWEGAEPVSGLALENIPGRHNMIASGASGFGLMALLVGTERNFITRQQATGRLLQTIRFLEKAQTFHGAFSHFIDGPTAAAEPFFGKRDNGGDLVETAFLMQGLLAARAYFTRNDPQEKDIRSRLTALWQKVEWDWYRKTPDSKFLYWHWSPDQTWVINHRLIGWNETMITYLLAMASPSHPVPGSLYYSGWATRDSIGQDYRDGWGATKEGALYSNGNTYCGIKLDVGVSNGGPLFFTHYSFMAVDPHLITDKYTNYYQNNRNIALINYRYCVENPHKFAGYGDSCWGLTASDGPEHYSPDEPRFYRDEGKITHTGAISSFPYTPAESWAALKNYYYNYGKFLWGEYGFRDAFSLSENWCSQSYMGLNQAPMVVMIENYRTGLIWKIMAKDPDVQQSLKKLSEAE